MRGCPSRLQGVAWPVDKEGSSEGGDRLIELTRDLETDEAMVVVVEKMEDQYIVKLRKGVDLALDLYVMTGRFP